jgi:hypothetical protein
MHESKLFVRSCSNEKSGEYVSSEPKFTVGRHCNIYRLKVKGEMAFTMYPN